MGARVLAIACRVSLEPDTCVSTTKDTFARKGVKSLVVAKFLPGIDILTPPLAGMAGVRLLPFVLWSGAGAFLWLVTIGGIGYFLGNSVEDLPAQIERLGSTLGYLVVGSIGMYVGWKYLQRRRVLRALRVARITPEELYRMMLDGTQPVIVDVRTELSLELLPFTIPGALFITPEELDRRHGEIPRDKELILFCACPNEASSARMALRLKRFGITRVRPLAGGIEAWHSRHFPVVSWSRTELESSGPVSRSAAQGSPS